MTEGKMLSISDFEWASAAQYIVYLSDLAGLEEISSDAVFCFRVGKSGVKGLFARKIKALALLQENRRKLERLVGEKEIEIGKDELAIIRGIWTSISGARGIVEDHVGRLRRLLEEEEQRDKFNTMMGKEEETNEQYF